MEDVSRPRSRILGTFFSYSFYAYASYLRFDIARLRSSSDATQERPARPLDCPECHGDVIFPRGLGGEAVCRKCGLVVPLISFSHDFIDWTPEWYSKWDKEDPETLRRWLTTLRTVSCQLSLPHFPYREEAARIVRLRSSLLCRSQKFGKHKREAVAALFHVVLREYGKIRPIKEICHALSLDPSMVLRFAWHMQGMLGGNRTSAEEYLRTYAYDLKADVTLIPTAQQLLRSINYRGGNPVSLAAGALYHVCKLRKLGISTQEIGNAFHISDRTVYSNERKIRELVSRGETSKYSD